MLDNTKAMIAKSLRDIKLFLCVLTVVSQLTTVAYLVYASVCGLGFLPVNASLSAIYVAYLAFYLMTYNTKERETKKRRRSLGNANRRLKLLVKTVTLAVSFYGIYISVKETTAITIIFSTLSILFWILQVIFEIVYIFVAHKAKLFVEGLKADFAAIIEPAKKVGEFVQTVAKKEEEVVEKVKEIASATGKGIREVGGIISRINPFGKRRKALRQNEAQAEPVATRVAPNDACSESLPSVKISDSTCADPADTLPSDSESKSDSFANA